MRQLDGPGSETRLRRIQERFRAIRARADRRLVFAAAAPWMNQFLVLFASFLAVGAIIWWFVS